MKWVLTYILFYISGLSYAHTEVYDAHWNRQLEKDVVKDASDFGAIYNSEKDQSNAFQNAVYECSAKKWKLKISGLLTLKSSVYLPSDTYIFSDNNGGFDYYGKALYCLMSKEGAKNITLQGLNACNKDNDAFCFFKCYRSRNVLVSACTTNMTIIHIEGKRDGYLYAQSDYNKCKNITVKNCNGTGTFIKGGLAAILIQYATDVIIENNNLTGYRHGIMWWGGDSNPEKDGAPENERKCKNILVIGNKVENAEGGIWGSMGRNVTVENNDVKNCSDVGIDFEGCDDSKAIGNRVIDAKNGNLATFFLNRNISFINNTAISTKADGYAVIKIYNSSLDADNNSGIFFEGNNITATNGEGYFYVEPCGFLTIKNNAFNNVCIKTIAYNHGNFLIKDNKFNMSNAINEAYFIDIAGLYNQRLVSIKRNEFTKRPQDLISGISVSSDDFETENQITIRNNRFNGFENNKNAVRIRRNIADKEIPKMFIDFSGNTENINLDIKDKRPEPKQTE